MDICFIVQQSEVSEYAVLPDIVAYLECSVQTAGRVDGTTVSFMCTI